MKLNIGAGDTVLDGFKALDRKFGDKAYPLTLQGEKMEGDSVDEMRASHVLEHFSFAQVPSVLRNWIHVLKPGGRIRIAVPDYDKIQEARKIGDKLWQKYLLGSQVDENDFHKSCFTRDGLQELMERAGLTDVGKWSSQNGDTACLPVSLNLEGTKPSGWVEEPETSETDVRIAAIMSQPRYCAGTPRGAIESALRPFGIPMHHFQGAYWSHCMQNAFEDLCICDWLITFDYDTMVTAKHIDRMLMIFGRNPHIDALCALQVKRHQDTPLLTVSGEDHVETDGRPFKATTGHFGCTLIRCDALRQVPLPWFWEIPRRRQSTWRDDKEFKEDLTYSSALDEIYENTSIKDIVGHDGDIHIDADIWFWKQWAKAGNSLYVAPDVRVGHLEEIVADYGEDMKIRHLYSHKWREHHREPEPEEEEAKT